MTSDDSETVIEGDITSDADFEDVAAIRAAIRDRGFAVEIDFSDGSITVERGPDVEPGGEVQLSEEYQDMSSKEIIAAVRDEHSLDGTSDGDSERELAEKAREAKRGDGQYEPLDVDDATDQESEAAESERSDTEDEEQQDDTVEEPDADPEQEEEEQNDEDEQQEEQELTKRERRIQRLKDGIEDDTAYTSKELAAIAVDKPVADVTSSDRQKFHNARQGTDLGLDSMDDPNRNGTAKLYYRGEQPDIEEQESEEGEEREKGNDSESPEPSSSADDADADDIAEDGCDCPTDEAGEPIHVEDCPEYVEREVKQMTRDAIRDELRDSGIKETADAFGVDEAVVEEIHDDMDGDAWYDAPDGDTDESSDDEDDEELLDDIGPCNIGKIAVKGTFRRYECQCGKTFEEEQSAMDHSDDTGHTLGWMAYDQLPKDHRKSLAKVSGPSTMR